MDKRTAAAYICGVLHGDGWCNSAQIGLHVKDLDFAETFSVAVQVLTERKVRPSPDCGKYWRVVVKSVDGNLASFKAWKPRGHIEIAAWLRGMFDSEGNACLYKVPKYPDSWHRRVSMYSTNRATLNRARAFLDVLSIGSRIRPMKSGGRFGTKRLYEVAILHSEGNFARFVWMIGSSINRKLVTLRHILLSYKTDRGASIRAAQLKGAAAKRLKTETITLPRVVKAINKMIRSGKKPTQTTCRRIPGFSGIQRHVSMSELINMATGKQPLAIRWKPRVRRRSGLAL